MAAAPAWAPAFAAPPLLALLPPACAQTSVSRPFAKSVTDNAIRPQPVAIGLSVIMVVSFERKNVVAFQLPS
jgi:hypothetical protein